MSIPFCRATQNSTHLLIYTPLNGCGTQVNETQDALIFWNEIRMDAVIIDNVITRTHDIRLPFYCHYSRNKMLSLSFKPRSVFFGQEGAIAIPLLFVWYKFHLILIDLQEKCTYDIIHSDKRY